ncbi:hypothetical protein E2C01_074584 [Portunus trituberculatus]|uniref:Uncharacterized protein n=1 Tax=Portunus trituberculatus TaxID=210409 RepID=A0A5B7I3N8_PORTR|nr:hypothetical protein [Portunus trituberculatus]
MFCRPPHPPCTFLDSRDTLAQVSYQFMTLHSHPSCSYPAGASSNSLPMERTPASYNNSDLNAANVR